MHVATLRNDARRPRFAAVAALASGLVLGSLGCGGSGNNEQVILPPGGIAIGEILCNITSSIPGDTLIQGEVVTVTFSLRDANQRVVGQFLPISFEVMGGWVPNPPDLTDENGSVTVDFVTDPEHLGAAFVRLIQPDYDLRCDITFRLVQRACTLTSVVLDGMNNPIGGTSGCGVAEVAMERDMTRTIVFTVTRPDSVTEIVAPVQGAYLLIRTNGQVPATFEVGPTDANGEVEVVVAQGGDVEPHPESESLLTVSATVLIADSNGDGLPDALECNDCSASFDIMDPPCDQNGGTVTVDYFEADGDPRAMDVLRPGEYAMLSFQITVDGVPLADEEVFVQAENGALNGSGVPITVWTDMNGEAAVMYQAYKGFGGTLMDPAYDTITFEAASSPVDCKLSGEVAVATCGLDLSFAAPPTQGVPVDVTVEVLYVDPDTADGRMVALSGNGGTLSPPADLSGPLMGTMRDLVFTPGASATEGLIALSFLDGYPCNTSSASFDIASP